MKATVVYISKTGTTQNLGEKIAEGLNEAGVEANKIDSRYIWHIFDNEI